jgi:hypothetical protein
MNRTETTAVAVSPVVVEQRCTDRAFGDRRVINGNEEKVGANQE